MKIKPYFTIKQRIIADIPVVVYDVYERRAFPEGSYSCSLICKSCGKKIGSKNWSEAVVNNGRFSRYVKLCSECTTKALSAYNARKKQEHLDKQMKELEI